MLSNNRIGYFDNTVGRVRILCCNHIFCEFVLGLWRCEMIRETSTARCSDRGIHRLAVEFDCVVGIPSFQPTIHSGRTTKRMRRMPCHYQRRRKAMSILRMVLHEVIVYNDSQKTKSH